MPRSTRSLDSSPSRFSARKEQAIYDAIHEAIMQLRIRLQREKLSSPHGVDTLIAQAGHAAGMAAIAVYRTPLKRKAKR